MMNKLLNVLLLPICCVQIQAMEHEASLCLGICNSTEKEINFKVGKLLDSVVFEKTISDFSVKAKDRFLIAETFINFNQYEIGKNKDEVLRMIDITCDNTIIGTMQLICSKYCPAPFYKVEKRENSNFFIQKKKFKYGGGPTTLEIVENKK